MGKPRRRARVNVKALVILLIVAAVLAVGAFVGRSVRKRMIAGRALEAGRAALQKEDFPAACRHLKRYLSKYPDDVEVLAQYARAQLSVRPLGAANVGAAVGAYRRLLRLRPDDVFVYDQLARLYLSLGNFSDLAHVARKRLERVPGDARATLWLARALLFQGKTAEARRRLASLVETLDRQAKDREQYVEACALLSAIAMQDGSEPARTEALEWLDRAVQYAPQSARALANRARFYRVSPPVGGRTREQMLAAAQADLARASALEPEDPLVRLILSREWMLHGRLDRAAAELEAVRRIDHKALEERFLDPSDWVVATFRQAADLSLRRRTAKQGVALADEVLGAVTDTRRRVMVLPAAVELYAAGGEAEAARRCLEEYLEKRLLARPAAGAEENVVLLKAIVARAEGRSARVIDLLEPVVARDPSRPRLWRLLAEAYGRTDQPDRARHALQEYVRFAPEDAEAAKQLARAYIEQQDWQAARQAASRLQQLAPADVEAKLLRIEADLYALLEQADTRSVGGLQALAKELAALRASHPESAKIRMLQAVLAVQQGRYDAAERELKSAIEQCSGTLDVELQLADLYAGKNRRDEAIEVCRAACRRHPEAAAAWIALAELQRTSKRYAAARKALQAGLQAVTEPARRRDLVLRLALLELLHGDRAAGVRLLTDQAEKDPRDVQARLLLLSLPEVRRNEAAAAKIVEQIRDIQGQGSLLWRIQQAAVWLSSSDWREKESEIVAVLTPCIEADPAWAEPALLLGRMYERLGNLDRAEAVYRRALTANPAAGEVADRLLSLLERRERFGKAKDLLHQIGAGVRPPATRTALATAGIGDLSPAIEHLKVRVAGDPQDVTSRIVLARLVYRQTSDAEQALAYLDEAQAVGSASMAITATRVAILKAEGRLAEARRLLDEAVQRSGTFEAYLLRAVCLADMGEIEQAEKDYIHLTQLGRGGEAFGLLAYFYVETNRIAEAIATWEEGLKADPDNLSLLRGLAKGLLARQGQGDRERAAAILARLAKRLPDDPELLQLQARMLLAEGTPEARDKAQRILERVVAREPAAVEAHLELIRMALSRGDLAAARNLAVRAQGGNPNEVRILLARARVEQALRDSSMAGELAGRVLGLDPDNAEARDIFLAAALRSGRLGLLEQARRWVELRLTAEPDDESLRVALARILYAMGQANLAVKQLEAYCGTPAGQQSVAALLALADLHRARADFAAAGKRIEQAAALAPDNSAVLRARIVWLAAQNRLDDVAGLVADYRGADGADPAVLVAAGRVLASSQSPQHRSEAMQLFERAATLDPRMIPAQLGSAVLAYKAGDVERAERIYRKVLAIDPNHPQALNDLAWILAEVHRDYEAALKLADKCLTLVPNNVHLRDTRGMILSHLPGRLADARKEFEKCVELTAADSPARARALLNLGRICAKLEDLERARRHLDEALRIDKQQGVFTDEERSEIGRILETSVRAD